MLEVRSPTPHVQHALDDGAHHGGLSEHNKLESIGGNERDILAGCLSVHCVCDGAPMSRAGGCRKSNQLLVCVGVCRFVGKMH